MEGRKIDGTSALVGVLAGCMAGLGTGYLLGRYVSKRAMEREIAREVDSVRDHYRAKTGPAVSRDYAGSPGTVPPVGTARRTLPDLSFTGRSGSDPRFVTEPQGPVDPDGGEFDDDEEGDDDPDGDSDPDDADDPANFRDAGQIGAEVREKEKMVYGIPAEEFFDETASTYQKISISYFEGDGVLVDDRKNPIPNPYAVVGNFREGFGKDPTNPHISYVRNDKIRVDFEIAMEEGTYPESLNYGRPP